MKIKRLFQFILLFITIMLVSCVNYDGATVEKIDNEYYLITLPNEDYKQFFGSFDKWYKMDGSRTTFHNKQLNQ